MARRSKTNNPLPKGSGIKLTNAQKAEVYPRIVRMYESGLSVRAIARAEGRSYGWVWKVLDLNHIQMRPRGGDTRSPRARRNQ
jgi:DNA invertase Pin-like site-specific DNA recombinase